MAEPDRTLLILIAMRTTPAVHSPRFDALDARLTREFSEIHDRLRRLDERIDGFIVRVEKLERA
jgi:hypothetical protein